MKKLFSAIAFILLMFLVVSSQAQYNQWTWMNGTTTGTIVYGTKGIPDSSNTPGSVYEASEWTDTSGVFWLLKGQDFWNYDPDSNMWTWMASGPANFGVQGIPSASNYPGPLTYAVSTWTDHSNNLWLYGGVSTGNFSDNLWKYNIASGLWTWMKGSGTCTCSPGVYGSKGVAAVTNNPPGRAETSCTWTDSAGNLWFFSGQTPTTCNCSAWSGATAGFSDIWKYDLGTNNWTWMSGPSVPSQPAVYGTKGIPSTANTPGGRWAYASSKQANGDFIFFGGALNGSSGTLKNDLWRYNSKTDQWTWLSGKNTNNDTGTFGTKCVPDTSNIPRSAIETRSRWTDDCGNLWLIGSSVGNALWRYSVANNTWTWVTGSSTTFPSAVYGTVGISNPANTPGNVSGGSPWRTATDFFLLNNVLWRYKPDKPTASFTNSSNPCTPSTINFTNTSTPGCNEIKSYVWNFGETGSGVNDTSTAANPSHTYSSAGTYNVQLKVTNCTGSKDSITVIIQTSVPISASIDSTPAICGNSNGSATVSASGGTPPYTYNWSNGTTSQTASSLIAGSYTVTVTDIHGCTYSSQVTVVCTSGIKAIFTSSDTAFCNETGQCIDFFDHSTNNPTSWKWSFPGATPDTSTQQNPTNICYYTAGTYAVTLIVSNSNGSDSLTVSPMITFSSGTTPPVVTLSGDTLFSTHGSTFQWYLNGSPITGATDSFYVCSQSGTYSVRITDSLGCSALSNGVYNSCLTGVKELKDGSEGVVLYPNPVSDELLITFNFPLSPDFIGTEIIITDIVGKELVRKTVAFSSSHEEVRVTDLSNGIYFLQIQFPKASPNKAGQAGQMSGQTINNKFIVLHK